MLEADVRRLGHAAELLDGLRSDVLGRTQVGASALDGLREAEAGERLEALGVAVEPPRDDVASGLADLPSYLAVGP